MDTKDVRKLAELTAKEFKKIDLWTDIKNRLAELDYLAEDGSSDDKPDAISETEADPLERYHKILEEAEKGLAKLSEYLAPFASLTDEPDAISETENINMEAKDCNVYTDIKKNSPVTWANGTDLEIKIMLEAHYLGIINIEDYWNIGDTRKVVLNESYLCLCHDYVDETQPEQEVELVIIGFNHDDLAQTYFSRNKAAVTVQVKNCLSVTGPMDSNPSPSFDVTDWNTTMRRKWCDSFETGWIKDSVLDTIVKPVIKLSNRYCDSESSRSYAMQSRNVCKWFLLSESEIVKDEHSIAYHMNNLPADGTQYPYYEEWENKYKSMGGSDNYVDWWTRSSIINHKDEVLFLCGSDNGYIVGHYKDKNNGIAPAFCL